jgi:hypothetical protein
VRASHTRGPATSRRFRRSASLKINRIWLDLVGTLNRTFDPYSAAINRNLISVVQNAVEATDAGYSWSYLACRTEHLVPIRQLFMGARSSNAGRPGDDRRWVLGDPAHRLRPSGLLRQPQHRLHACDGGAWEMLASPKPIGNSWSCFARRIGHVVPIWQLYIGSSAPSPRW